MFKELAKEVFDEVKADLSKERAIESQTISNIVNDAKKIGDSEVLSFLAIDERSPVTPMEQIESSFGKI